MVSARRRTTQFCINKDCVVVACHAVSLPLANFSLSCLVCDVIGQLQKGPVLAERLHIATNHYGVAHTPIHNSIPLPCLCTGQWSN